MADVTVGGREVVIDSLVRRFFCDQTACARKTFAEQVEELTVPHARHTVAARQVLASLALAVGARTASGSVNDSRCGRVGLTLLRLIRRQPDPVTATPRILGVDDFALRRGHRDGTILINVETGQPVDVLADRTAETFTAWLKAHPGVEIICRDRGGSYAEGANKGAPFAMQVADRWHLVHNLSQAVERAVTPMRRYLQPADQPAEPDAIVLPQTAATSPIVTRTRNRHADVHALLADGHGIYTIARGLNLDPKTVRRYADVPEGDDLLDPRRRFRVSVLDRFTAHLQRRCAEGETGTTTLLAEIRALGDRGGPRTLRRWLVGVRGPEPQTCHRNGGTVHPRHHRTHHETGQGPHRRRTGHARPASANDTNRSRGSATWPTASLISSATAQPMPANGSTAGSPTPPRPRSRS